MNSTHRKDFNGKKGDETDRPKPEDLLKTGGPSPHLTTYSSGFPGYRGQNQYVKPTDLMTRGNFPLQAQTTYGKAFIQRPGRAASLGKTPDNFRCGAPWLGKTTYGNSFQAPNPENYANRIRFSEKVEVDPKFKHQYGTFMCNSETVYKNDFLNAGSRECRAKRILEGIMRGKMLNKKNKFT